MLWNLSLRRADLAQATPPAAVLASPQAWAAPAKPHPPTGGHALLDAIAADLRYLTLDRLMAVARQPPAWSASASLGDGRVLLATAPSPDAILQQVVGDALRHPTAQRFQPALRLQAVAHKFNSLCLQRPRPWLPAEAGSTLWRATAWLHQGRKLTASGMLPDETLAHLIYQLL
jgi:hypothetical protein